MDGRYNKAKAAGIQVGAYYDSVSFNEDDAEIEAHRVLKILVKKDLIYL